MIKKIQTQKKAFTIIEVMMVLVITGVTMLGFIKVVQNYKEDRGYAEERAFNTIISNGINTSFLDIIEAFQGSASSFIDSSANWGWSLLKDTSAFPIYSTSNGLPTLLFRLDEGLLSASKLAELQGKIASNFNGACTRVSDPQMNGNVALMCPKLRNLIYDVGGTSLTTPQNVGAVINPSLIPIVKVSFLRDYPTNRKAPTVETYTFNMSDVYLNRRNYSMRRITTIKTAMENFHNRAITKEIANSSTGGGLNSMDDIFVPWMWKIFGDNATKIDTLCNKTGTSCSNLNTNEIWRNSVSNKGLLTRRVFTNLLGGDSSYAIDGFNNPIFILPFMSDCPTGTNDLTACPINVPSVPSDNYLTIGNPPFITAIYTPSFRDKTIDAPDYGRVYLSY